MALVLGELATILKADDKPLEQGLDRGKASVRKAGIDMERIAHITGEHMGEEITKGADGKIQDGRGRFIKAAQDSGEKGGGAASSGFLAKMGPALATGAAAIGAAAGTALTVALTSALDVEAAQAKLAAQVGATGKEAEDLGRIAGNLYAGAWGESMGQVTEAVGAVISSIDDMRGDDAVEATTAKVLDLANAFGIDVAQAAQLAGQTVKSGLAKNSAEALDLITYSMQRVPAAVRGDLLDALDEYGPFLKSIGVTGEKAFGLLVKGAEKGMYGIDKTGDALKEFTIRATDMSTASKVGFDLLGMSQEKMASQLLKGGAAGAKAFDQIITGLRNIKDPVKQSQAALALFGTPLEDLSVSEIPKFLAGLDGARTGMDDAAGAAGRLGDTLHDTAAAKIQAFKNTAILRLTEAGGAIIGFFERVAANPKVREFLGDVKDFTDQDVVPALRRLWQWLEENVGPVLAKLADQYLSKARDALGELRQALKDNEPELRQFVGWLEKAAKFILEKVVPAVGPILTGGLATAIRMVKMTAQNIALMVRAFNTIKGAVTGAVSWVTSRFSSLVSFVRGLPGRISSAASGMFNGIRNAFRAAINWVIDRWNGLSFTLPSISVFGQTVGGGTLGTPNINRLAAGGIVPATPAGRLVTVAEAGEDEAVAPLSKLLPMIRDAVADAQGGDTYVYVEVDGTPLEGRIVRVVRGEQREHDRQLKRRATAGAGGYR